VFGASRFAMRYALALIGVLGVQSLSQGESSVLLHLG